MPMLAFIVALLIRSQQPAPPPDQPVCMSAPPQEATEWVPEKKPYEFTLKDVWTSR